MKVRNRGRKRSGEAGASLLEYAVLVALISVVALTGVTAVGIETRLALCKSSAAIAVSGVAVTSDKIKWGQNPFVKSAWTCLYHDGGMWLPFG